MKKYFPILLAFWPYLIFVVAAAETEGSQSYLFNAYMILTMIMYIANIIYAFKCTGENSGYRLAFWNMVVKLAHIPFYLFIAVLGFTLVIAMVIPLFTLLSPIMIIILMVSDFFLMATTSMYGVNALIRANRQKTLSVKFVIVNLILHFIFVLDVVSSVLVFSKLRKLKKEEMGLGV